MTGGKGGGGGGGVREEAIEDVVPNDLDSKEGQIPEVISDDEDHEDTVRSELTTSQALQHLDELLKFSIAKKDETLFGLLSEETKAIENIIILSLRQSNIPSFFKNS